MKPENKQFWTGVAIGAAVGGTICFGTGYMISKKKTEKSTLKKHKEELRRARIEAFDDGKEEAIVEAQRWIDENVLTVNAEDPKSAMNVIEGHFKASEAPSKPSDDGSKGEIHKNAERVKKASESPEEAFLDPKTLTETSIETYPDDSTPIDRMPEPEPKDTDELAKLTLDTNNQVLVNYHDDVIAVYPRELFFRDDGESYSETQIRARLMEYEKNIRILRRVWQAFGWGEYYPDPTIGAPTPEEMDNWDLEIDSKYGDEPEEQTIERQRYLDEVDRYKAHPEEGARIISKREFSEESYLPMIYVDYYDVDNKFVESTDFDNELDAYDNFGVTDGTELFGKRNPDDDDDDSDPDIVHVKNFKMHFVAEVTRFHKSFASVKDGSAYVNGDPT